MIKTGEPITKKQKALFHRLLNTQDLIDISTDVDYSYATVRSIYYRTQPVTEENKEVVYKIINKSLEKSREAIIFFKKAESELTTMLPSLNSY